MMILRALFIALACACAASQKLLPAGGDDNDCALYLTGPGRTSAYDYSLNLLKGNFGYEGQHTCITYDAVNQAYLDARNRILVSQPKGDWKPEDYASVGELILDISINLARTYGLTYEEIEKGLPLIDTSRTLIREVCPPVFSHVECRAGKYRRLDGLCNNLEHPTWGATNAPFQRLIGPLFADGINAPRISHTGRDLPLSRVVSRTIHPDEGFHDHAGTVMVIAWGQFMDHDYTLTGTPLDPINRNDPEECCKRPPHLKHPYCNEIRIPDDDYFYRLFNVKCIDFVRGFPSPRPGCRLGSRVPFNTLTGAIDGNTVYGVTEKFSRKLRTGYGGLLRMNPVFKEYGLKDLLPLKLDIPDEGCTRPNKNMYCFEAGEIRVNEQLVLTVMHTLMAREHNRVAEALAAVNPHWDDETLFQEARRINIAEIQHITYNEFLPILLGKDVMEKFGLVLEKEGYWDGYDSNVNPDVIASFASAAYRFGHSLLPTAVERWSKAHKFIASKRLSDLIRRPYDLYRAGVLDEYVMGLMNQVAQAMDDSITQEVTNHLFKKVGARFGMDLVSFNMQRGREFGIPGYMEFRKFCGLSGADSFQELFGSMPNETLRKYETIFQHPVDVDLWSGGVSERPLPGSMLGPTFACIIATQFSYSRRGDRFWFELPNQPSSFTPEQLKEIRKARLARVICDNTDIIDTVQLYPMVLPDHELNPRVPCRSGIIPSMDFSKWAEPAPFQGPAKQFITDAIIPVKNETNECQETAEVDALNPGPSETNETDLVQNCTDVNSGIIIQAVTPATISCTDDESLVSLNSTENPVQENCIEQDTIVNNTSKSDTVMKYVYKKNQNIVNEKHKGHPKNSLIRKKRSHDIQDTDHKSISKAPLIVNYETSHEPRHFQKHANIIQGSALADFNIETLHDVANKPVDKTSENQENVEPRHNLKSRDDSENVNESYNKNNEVDQGKSSRESVENDSRERESEEDDRSSSKLDKIKYPEPDSSSKENSENDTDDRRTYINNVNNDESNESVDKAPYIKRNHQSDESISKERLEDTERDDRGYSENIDNKESNERKDSYNSRENDNSERSRYSKPRHQSEESSSNETPENTENYSNRYVDKANSKERDDSNESIENLRNNKAPYFKPRHRSKEYVDEDTPKHYHSREVIDNEKSKYSKPSQDDSEKYNDDSGSRELQHSSGENTKPQHKNSPSDSKEYEPKQKYVNTSSEKSEYSKPRDASEEYDVGNFNKDVSIENAFDRIKQRVSPTKKPKDIIVNNNNLNHTPKTIIQDVDLGDFSYERVQINDKGQVEVAKDIYDESNLESSTKEQSSTTIRPRAAAAYLQEPDKDNGDNHSPSALNFKTDEEGQTTAKVNDGEIKPVVEINNESSNESGENIKESSKEVENEDQSLETFLGVKPTGSDEQNSKITAPKKEGKDNVKEQFERIPLNYKHDGKEESSPNPGEESITSEPSKNDENNEGTLDTLAPASYDDHLNIKFDDVAIKLPEIKLPDDILAYAYEEPSKKTKNNKKDKQKQQFYRYEDSEEDSEEDTPQYQPATPNYDDHGYYGYYGDEEQKQKYKKKQNQEEEDDEDVDLYEKFVRERFGKRGSFEKRSEKLQDYSRPISENSELFSTLQNVLKKTENIEKQAEKSGDPNARYAWTLEYGKNL